MLSKDDPTAAPAHTIDTLGQTQPLPDLIVSALKLLEIGEPGIGLDYFVCERFARLAHVRDSKRAQFYRNVLDALMKWYVDTRSLNETGAVTRRLLAMKHSATYLYEELAGVRAILQINRPKLLALFDKEGFSIDEYSLRLEVMRKLHVSSTKTGPNFVEMVNGMVNGIANVLALIERTLNVRGHSRGRPAGVRKYRGLDTLVFRLELSAQLAEGKFTSAKNPKGGKGTMIEALDLLRNELLTKVDDGERLATFIPVQGQHPASTYERAINDARKSARQPASDTRPCDSQAKTEPPRN
jgi:hypothetical protein